MYMNEGFIFIDTNTDQYYKFNHSNPDHITIEECNDSCHIKYEVYNMEKFKKDKSIDALPNKKMRITSAINITNIKHIYSMLTTRYSHSIIIPDSERKTAQTHDQVIQNMSYYMKIVRMAMNELYCIIPSYFSHINFKFVNKYQNLFSLLENKNSANNDKFVYMTEKGYTLNQTPDATIYGTVKMFIEQFSINPIYFENGIRYDAICDCIYNLYNWIAPIIFAYVKINIPDSFVIAFYTYDNGENFIETNLISSISLTNNIEFIVKNPINVLSIMKSGTITWDYIRDIMNEYGF